MPKTLPTSFDRDKQAELYAKTHFEYDPGVTQIFYLPTDAPWDEIRLLEVNKLLSEGPPPEPVDFGLNRDGADAHTLIVLDVTPSQWTNIQNGKLPLPTGWTMEGKREIQKTRRRSR